MTKTKTLSSVAQLSGLTSAHSKNLDQEKRLAEMNTLLAPLQAMLENGHGAPLRPPVFVLGPPRGGTTVTSQLLATSGMFGIATNFMARFWRASALGMTIQNALGFCDEPQGSSFESRRGVTPGWCEPSEFGYFWSDFFDLGQSTHELGSDERKRLDRGGLIRAVAAMERVSGRPMAFKNNTWFTLNADFLAQIFPGCTLVVCDRDPFFIAQSIWLQRLDHFGDTTQWWSVRPRDFDEIIKYDPLEQVAAQTASIKAAMAASLSNATGAKIVQAGYERLSADPRGVIGEIAHHAGISDAAIKAALEQLPLRLSSTDTVRLDAETATVLRSYVARHMALRGLAA